MVEIFWHVYLGLLGTAAIGFLIKGEKTLFYMVDFIISIFTWLGLFGYVTHTIMFTPFVWKLVFVGGLIWDIVFSLIKGVRNEELEGIPTSIRFILMLVTTFILLGPLYYGLFNYAF
ncbi:hypothetical protein [Priestia filamentosa]|uniref:hypothetical protein n=1 Tax=Priestia filamentosa TaxID=1402861 RepID=UPI002E20F903|nr:hypothetical protein [Priestia filamentosa]